MRREADVIVNEIYSVEVVRQYIFLAIGRLWQVRAMNSVSIACLVV